jgi:glycosyltransferase involved in cell wall biosynthesis
MKVLVFPYQLVVCGTVVNAIDLGAALRDFHGHDVVLFATPGPMAAFAEEKGLRLIPAPAARVHPSPARMRALREVVRRERPDVIHAWDWYQCLDAYYVEHLREGVPIVATDMEMTLVGLLPHALPTTYGTPELVDRARAAGYRNVELLLPPVDVHLNAPGAVDPRPFRERWGVEAGHITLVTVSRLDTFLKAESLYRTVEAVRGLARDLPVRLMIVGDGEVRADLSRVAGEVNAEVGRDAVALTGSLIDPRPAYAAADIVIGMGGSALRGMAFGKPVVVVGADGFSEPFTPESAPAFLYRGLYGVGAGAAGPRLADHIRALAGRPERLPSLGEFSRRFVVEHFGLEAVSGRLSSYLEKAAANPRRFHVAAADGIRTAAVWVKQRQFLPPAWRFRMKDLAGQLKPRPGRDAR